MADNLGINSEIFDDINIAQRLVDRSQKVSGELRFLLRSVSFSRDLLVHNQFDGSVADTADESSNDLDNDRRRAMRSSNTWTSSSGDVLSDSDDVNDRLKFVEEYNRLASKIGVRTLCSDDLEADMIDGTILSIKHGSWFSRNILRKSSSSQSVKVKNDRTFRHRRSISDLSRRSSRRDTLKDKDLQELVRLCGVSHLYLPADYAANSLTVPTCFRATAQYLIQHGPTARGVFRIPGSQSVIAALYNHYCILDEEGAVVAGTVRCPTLPSHIKCDVHDVASAFKRFLSGLPGGILGSLRIFDAFVSIHSQLHGDAELTRTKQSRVRARLIALSIATLKSHCRRDLICAVFGLLSLIGRAAETTRREDEKGRPLPTSDLMGYEPLGIVFGPLLLGELLDGYTMRLANPHGGLILLPATPPKARKERQKRLKAADAGVTFHTSIDKIKVANSITEMLITHWRDVVRHMRSLKAIKNTRETCQAISPDKSTQPILRPSASESFALRKPPAWPTSERIDQNVSPTPAGHKKALSHDNEIRGRQASPEPAKGDLKVKKQRSRQKKLVPGQRLSSAKSVSFLAPTLEENSETKSLGLTAPTPNKLVSMLSKASDGRHSRSAKKGYVIGHKGSQASLDSVLSKRSNDESSGYARHSSTVRHKGSQTTFDLQLSSNDNTSLNGPGPLSYQEHRSTVLVPTRPTRPAPEPPSAGKVTSPPLPSKEHTVFSSIRRFEASHTSPLKVSATKDFTPTSKPLQILPKNQFPKASGKDDPFTSSSPQSAPPRNGNKIQSVSGDSTGKDDTVVSENRVRHAELRSENEKNAPRIGRHFQEETITPKPLRNWKRPTESQRESFEDRVMDSESSITQSKSAPKEALQSKSHSRWRRRAEDSNDTITPTHNKLTKQNHTASLMVRGSSRGGTVKALASKFNTVDSTSPFVSSPTKPRKPPLSETFPDSAKEKLVAPYTSNPPSPPKSEKSVRSLRKPLTPSNPPVETPVKVSAPRRLLRESLEDTTPLRQVRASLERQPSSTLKDPIGSQKFSNSAIDGSRDSPHAEQASERKSPVPSINATLKSSIPNFSTHLRNSPLRKVPEPLVAVMSPVEASASIMPSFDGPPSVRPMSLELPSHASPTPDRQSSFDSQQNSTYRNIADFVHPKSPFHETFSATRPVSPLPVPARARSNSLLLEQIRTLQRQLDAKTEELHQVKRLLDGRATSDVSGLSEQLRQERIEVKFWRSRAEVAEKQLEIMTKLAARSSSRKQTSSVDSTSSAIPPPLRTKSKRQHENPSSSYGLASSSLRRMMTTPIRAPEPLNSSDEFQSARDSRDLGREERFRASGLRSDQLRERSLTPGREGSRLTSSPSYSSRPITREQEDQKSEESAAISLNKCPFMAATPTKDDPAPATNEAVSPSPSRASRIKRDHKKGANGASRSSSPSSVRDLSNDDGLVARRIRELFHTGLDGVKSDQPRTSEDSTGTTIRELAITESEYNDWIRQNARNSEEH